MRFSFWGFIWRFIWFCWLIVWYLDFVSRLFVWILFLDYLFLDYLFGLFVWIICLDYFSGLCLLDYMFWIILFSELVERLFFIHCVQILFFVFSERKGFLQFLEISFNAVNMIHYWRLFKIVTVNHNHDVLFLSSCEWALSKSLMKMGAA